jgi:hypothetical protein
MEVYTKSGMEVSKKEVICYTKTDGQHYDLWERWASTGQLWALLTTQYDEINIHHFGM